MTILTTPNLGGTIEPYLEILDGTNFDVIWTNNPKYKEGKNKERQAVFFKGFPLEVVKSVPGDSNMSIEIYENDRKVEFSGDLFFRIYNSKNKKLICRFAINTSFMDM